MITQEDLKAALHYDKNTGEFTWIKSTGRRIKAGDLADSLSVRGYIRIQVKGTRYYAHRLAWFYSHGVWPKGEIDHINHDKTDNRAENLRESTRTENTRNTSLGKNNTSGFNGVNWHKPSRRWVARICDKGKRIPLGSFKTKEAAIKKRKTANILYGYHENHGEIL